MALLNIIFNYKEDIYNSVALKSKTVTENVSTYGTISLALYQDSIVYRVLPVSNLYNIVPMLHQHSSTSIEWFGYCFKDLAGSSVVFSNSGTGVTATVLYVKIN